MVHEEHIENLRVTIEHLIEQGDLSSAVSLLMNRHAADQADLIEDLDDDYQDALIFALPGGQLAEILEYLGEDERRRLLAQIPANALAPVLDRVDEDLAADIVQDLEREQAEAVVELMEDRETVEELLSFPEESAGGRMSSDIVALKGDWTVGEAIEFLRNEEIDNDHPFYIYSTLR